MSVITNAPLGFITGVATNSLGLPLASFVLLVKDQATNTPVRTYSTSSPNSLMSKSGQVRTDAAGRYAFYAQSGRALVVVALDADGNQLFSTYDNQPNDTKDQGGTLSLTEAATLKAALQGGTVVGPAGMNAVFPLRNALVSGSVQFRGAADTAASLGTIGILVNADNNTSASTRFAASAVDYPTTINGASTQGQYLLLGPFATPVLRAHLAVQGLTAPYTASLSGPVSSATPDMLRFDFDLSDNVTYLEVHLSGPTNFAGASGTGSARMVSVVGLKAAV